MFENITAAPADPILGLADLFRADDRPTKINLGIGVYKDETGKTPVLTSVKKQNNICWKMKPPKTTSALTVFPNLAAARRNCCSAKAAISSAINAPVRRRPQAAPARCASRRISSPKTPTSNASGFLTRAGRTIKACLIPPGWKCVSTLITTPPIIRWISTVC